MGSETVLAFILGFGFTGAFCLVFFLLGKIIAEQRQTKEASLFAILSAFHAFSEAKALKNATVVQRFVERIVPGEQATEKDIQERVSKFEEEWAHMLGLGGEKARPKDKPENLV